jgi:16S rRNA (guanine(966)-N(2))-methyltransferase RsmD
MSLRIIAGSAKGQRIETPPGSDLRPTTDRVREALFSILQPRLEGAAFLDLFAGTGLNGFEALSRGAGRVTFIEADPKAAAQLRATSDRLGFGARATIYGSRLPQALAQLRDGPFDIVYLDPPYHVGLYEPVLQALAAQELLAPEGVIVCEHHPKSAVLPQAIGPWKQSRLARYGSSALAFFC